MSKYVLLILLIALICGCSGSESESYKQGQQMADEVYGSLLPEVMLEQADSVMQDVTIELQKAEDQRDFWYGFCDRGKEIWVDRIDEINSSFGQDILDTDEIKDMFDDMKSSFRE